MKRHEVTFLKDFHESFVCRLISKALILVMMIQLLPLGMIQFYPEHIRKDVGRLIDLVTPSEVAAAVPPVANAGPDQTAALGQIVQLDGTGSHDADGDPLSFKWEFRSLPAGSTANLSDLSIINPTFTIDLPGSYEVELTVTSGGGGIFCDVDADGDVDRIDVRQVMLARNKPATGPGDPRDADGNGTINILDARICVNAMRSGNLSPIPGLSVVDTVTITTVNSAPVANAGPDQGVFVRDTVLLDGSGSSDVDGDLLSYFWFFTSKPIDSQAVLSNSSALKPTITIDLPGTYVLSLIVNDGIVDSVEDSVTITTGNSAPVAKAGLDQTHFVGALVNLDGSGSSDADGDPLSYRWSLTTRPTGSIATLLDPTSLTPSFTIDLPGTYVAQLMVNDGSVDSPPDTVTISTNNSPPVADAGADQTVNLGELAQLDGSGSHDADNDLLTYKWALITIPIGSGVFLSDASSVSPSFLPDLDGTYVVQLIVNDGTVDGGPDTAMIEIVVLNLAPTISSIPVTGATEDQVYLYDVNATDPDAGDVLTFSLVLSSAGMTIDPATGVIRWLPVNADVGSHAVMVRVDDADGLFDTQSFSIAVANANDPPVMTSVPVTTAMQNQAYRYKLVATDLDVGDILVFSLRTAPAGMTVNPATGLIQWVPGNADVGVHSVTARVTDAGGLFDTQSFSITVLNVNDPPVVDTGLDQAINEGSLVSLAPSTFTDLDPADTHTATIDWGDGTPIVSGAVVESAGSGSVSGTHVYPDNGAFTVTVCVTDNGTATSCDPLNVVVANVAPVVNFTKPMLFGMSGNPLLPVDPTTGKTTLTENFDDGILDPHLTTLSTSGFNLSLSNGKAVINKISGTNNGALHIMTACEVIGDFTATVKAERNNLGNAEMGLSTRHGSLGFTDVFYVGLNRIHSNIFVSPGFGTRIANNSTSQVMFRIRRIGDTIFEEFDDGSGFQILHTVTNLDLAGPVKVGAFLIQAFDNSAANEAIFDDLVITSDGFTNCIAPILTYFTDPGVLDTHTANIDWGDGSLVEAGLLNQGAGSGSVAGSHVYTASGTFTVKICVTDDDGGTGCGSAPVTVTANHPPVITSPPVTAVVVSNAVTAPLLISDFDDNTLQGWTAEPFFGGALFVQNSGGNPHAFMTATDTVAGGGDLRARAPASLVGNLSDFGGIQWDERLPSNSVIGTTVILIATDGTSYRSINPVGSVETWNTRTLSFSNENDWILVSGTATLEQVLLNIDSLFLSFDVTTVGTEEAGIDNVTLLASNRNQAYAYDVKATDPDASDTLTFSLDIAPLGMTIDPTTGLIEWTPNITQIGVHPVTVRVQDSGGLFDTQIFNITVGFGLGCNDNHSTTFLSDFLGLPSGQTTFNSNQPFSTVVAASRWGIGVDTAGNWTSSRKIRFQDTGFFCKGIGAHPRNGEETVIIFHLNEIRNTGKRFNKFSAVVGIDPVGGGDQGAIFNVYLDGIRISTVSTPNVNTDSVQVDLPLNNAKLLTLGTERLGGWNGNHAAWASARLYCAGDDCDGGSPMITSTPITSATEGQVYSYDVEATDPDVDDVLTFSLDMAPSGMAIDPTTGLVAWTPTTTQVGANPVTARVQDSGGLSDTQNFTITVANINDPPSITSTAVTTGVEGFAYAYDVEATDPDVGDVLAFSLSTAPPGMTIDALTGLIAWTPTPAQVGIHSVTVRVQDSDGLFDTQSFTVTINNLNHPPVAVDDAYSVDISVNFGSERPAILIINGDGGTQGGKHDKYTKSILGPEYDFIDFRADLSALDLSQYNAISMQYTCPYKELTHAENEAIIGFIKNGGGVVLNFGVPGGFGGIQNPTACAVFTDLTSSVPNGVNTAQWVEANTYKNSCGNIQITQEHYITQDFIVGDMLGGLSCGSTAGLTDTVGTVLAIGTEIAVVIHTFTPFPEGGHVVFQSVPSCNLPAMKLLSRAFEYSSGFKNSTTVLDLDSNGISDGCEQDPGLLTVGAPGVLSNDSDPDGDPLTAILVNGPTQGTLDFKPDGSFSYVPDRAPILPVRQIPNLVSITFWERTGGAEPSAFTFGVNSPQLTTRSNNPSDFTGAGTENYDVFYSNADGSFNIDGKFVTVESVFSRGLPRGGGLNLAEMQLNFLDGSTQFGSFVSSFVALGDNGTPDNVGNAVDGNLLTHTTMGNTIGQSKRLRVTIGLSDIDRFTYKANDGSLDSNEATVTITVNQVNTPPVITSAPATLAIEGNPYQYDVDATDADGDVLNFSLAAPLFGMTDAQNGSSTLVEIDRRTGKATPVFDFSVPSGFMPFFMTFHPPSGQFLTVLYPVDTLTNPGPGRRLGVLDPETQTLTVYPFSGLPAGNMDVAGITYHPLTDRVLVTFGRTGSFLETRIAEIDLSGNVLQVSPDLGIDDRDNLDVHPPSGDVLSIDLNASVEPRFAAINNIFVSPTFTEFANPPLTSEVYDVAVSEGGEVFVVRRIPNHELLRLDGNTYQPIGAFGLLEKQVLALAFGSIPDGMTIDATTGEITWTPNNTQRGIHYVTVQVSDGQGGEDTQSFAINVSPMNNTPPVITSTPITGAEPGFPYSYDVEATDPDADPLTFALTTAPSGMTIDAATGMIAWTPGILELGAHPVEVAVTDLPGGSATQSFVVTVVNVKHPPVVSAIQNQTVEPPNLFTQIPLDDFVTDLDHPDSALSWKASGNLKLSVSITNRVATISYPEGTAVTEQLSFTATDPDGLSSSTSTTFTVTLSDHLRPEVTLTASPPITPLNAPVTITVIATDNVGVVATALTINGNPLALDAAGQARVTSALPGVFTAVATARDAAGNEGLAQQEFRFLSPDDDGVFPLAAFTSPSAFARISQPTDIIGSASDDNLSRYILEYSPQGKDHFLPLGSGTTSVTNGFLGSIDPTRLKNGLYEIRLTAEDASGNIAIARTTFQVEGQLKVGNFTLTFEDLVTPVAGIPITITRTYDSRVKTRGDFGIGWTLGIADIKIFESGVLGEDWEQVATIQRKGPLTFPVFSLRPTTPRYVMVVYPDGRIDEFNMVVTPSEQPLVPIKDVKAFFVPADGTFSTLEILSGNELNVDSPGAGPVNLFDAGSFNLFGGNRYKLTTPEGRVFIINAPTGLESIADGRGNTLTLGTNGITHSSGKSITFTRDAADRISALTDPMGNTIHYEYDHYGDLVGVSNQEAQLTRITYNADHGLLDYIDPRGVKSVRNEYDNQGRLIAQIDAEGNRTIYTHHIGTKQEVTRDRLGNATVFNYDDAGNILSHIDPLGHTTAFTYDVRGNRLSQTDPLGRTKTFTYDERNNLLTETDALGNITTGTYNSRNQILTKTDPMEQLTQHEYDASGNPTSTSDPLRHIIRNTYDAQGNLTSTTDALGHVRSHTYDADGNRTRTTDPLGRVTTITYDASGNPLTETTTRTHKGLLETITTSSRFDRLNQLVEAVDPVGAKRGTAYNLIGRESAFIDALGNRTELKFNARGNVTRFLFPDGAEQLNTYDLEGRVIMTTNRGGQTITTTYDPLRRPVKILYGDRAFKEMTYDAAGQLISEKDERGNITRFTYDAAGRRISTTDALGKTTSFSYDRNDNLTKETDAKGHITLHEYDANNRKTRTLFADGTSVSTAYDALGRKTSETDQAGIITRFAYDALGRLTSVTDALGGETRYAYDEVGNLISQIDAKGAVTQFEYDASGRMTRRTLPLGMTEILSYDLKGNVISKTDFNGQTTSFSYDKRNKLTRKTFADGTSETYTYTKNGNRKSVVDGRGETSYVYDIRDRLLRRTDPDGKSLIYTYDAAGNRTSVTTPAGKTTYTYDVQNRLATVTDSKGGVTSYAYDAVGNRNSVAYPNGTRATYTYDATNRLTRLVNSQAGGAVLSAYTYVLGPTGNRIQVTEETGRVVDYSYDALYRLTGERINDPISGLQEISFTYDAVWNRLTKTDDGLLTTYTYDANDRLLTENGTTFTYDSNGNMLTQSSTTENTTYAYDFQNRMSQANIAGTNIRYAYDADGIRIQKEAGSSVTHYLIDHNRPFAQVLLESDGLDSPKVSYTYGDDLILQTRDASTSYYHYDGQLSSRLLTDETGVLSDTYTYDAFGNALETSGNTENNYRYTGEQLDSDLGLYYLRARYNSPERGRFITQDPFLGKLLEPATLHRYLYANGNPVNNIDPSGEFSSLVEALISTNILAELQVINATNMFKTFLDIFEISRCTIEPASKLRNIALIGIAKDAGVTAYELEAVSTDMLATGFIDIEKRLNKSYQDIYGKFSKKIKKIATPKKLSKFVDALAEVGDLAKGKNRTIFNRRFDGQSGGKVGEFILGIADLLNNIAQTDTPNPDCLEAKRLNLIGNFILDLL